MAEMTPEDKAQYVVGIMNEMFSLTHDYLEHMDKLLKHNRDVVAVAEIGLVMAMNVGNHPICQAALGSKDCINRCKKDIDKVCSEKIK